MQKLTLNFFGEEVAINIPKDLTSLRKEISEKFMFSPSDTAEIILTYIKDLGKKIIQTESDFSNFISEKINKINLDISQDSKLYKESLKTLEKENKEKTKKAIKLKAPKKNERLLSYRDIEKRPLTTGINHLCQKVIEKSKWLAKKETEKQFKRLQKFQQLAKKLDIKLTSQESQFINEYPKFSENIIQQIEVWSNIIKDLTRRLTSSMEQKNIEFKNYISPLKNRIKEKMQIPEKLEKKLEKNSLKISEKNIKKIIEVKNERLFSHRDIEQKPLTNGFNTLCKKLIEKSNFLCEKAIEKQTKRITMFKKKAISMNIELNENEKKFFDDYKNFSENIKQQIQAWSGVVNDNTKRLVNSMGMKMAEQKKIINNIKQKIEIKNNEKLKNVKKNVNEKPVHKFVKCDGCGMHPIIGCRFKCTVCDNFDYCENCEKKFCGSHHQHPFLKIYRPEMKPISIKCVLNDTV